MGIIYDGNVEEKNLYHVIIQKNGESAMKKFLEKRRMAKKAIAEIKANGFAYVNKEVRNHLYDRGYMVATECGIDGLYRVQPGI